MYTYNTNELKPETCGNMIEAEAMIYKAARLHFYGNAVGGIQKMKARKAGKLKEYEAFKASLDEDWANDSSAWMKNYCRENFSRFWKTQMYKALMGEIVLDQSNYYYTPREL